MYDFDDDEEVDESAIKEENECSKQGTEDKSDKRAPRGCKPEDYEEEEEEEERTRTVVYFWQGRLTSDIAWLQFNFSVRKDMSARLSRNPVDPGRPLKVEFKHVHQQQEDLVFLAHFRQQFVIHLGHYKDRYSDTLTNSVQMYHLRANGNPIASRCIEVRHFITILSL
ncbi:unnamed protein product [Protopolystoma xenopodis]|uniref:Gelsolin-like domain-containing protein n=1 Tax=Protopolystoma xenopodis TaxID=117903 RepID=A0A448X6S2_9PLAT|nr:unnamed protein product [Protopolystoma xenopodis]